MDAIVRASGVRKVYRSGTEVEALKKVDLDVIRGEMVAIVGPSGLRQDDPPQLPVRARTDRRRRDPHRRHEPRDDVGRRPHRVPRALDGVRVPGVQPSAGPFRGRERRDPAAPHRHRRTRGAASGRSRPSSRSGSGRAPTIGPISSPAASSSASPSPARSSIGPRSSGPTSRPVTSTRNRRRPSWSCSAALNRDGQTIVMVTHDAARGRERRSDHVDARRADRGRLAMIPVLVLFVIAYGLDRPVRDHEAAPRQARDARGRPTPGSDRARDRAA